MTTPLINATQPWDILTYCNTVTRGWFGSFTLLIIWLAAFMSMTGRTTNGRAFAAATFITECLAMIFWFIGIVDVGIVYLGIGMIILSVIFLGTESR